MQIPRVPLFAHQVLAVFAVILSSQTALAQPIYQVSGSTPSPNNPTVRGAEMVEFNGELFFGDLGGLYRSDGTPGGVALVKAGINPEFLTVMDVAGSPRLFFAAVQAGAGKELWTSDGTDPGTVMLKDIRTGATGSNPAELTVVNLAGLGDRLLMQANNGTNGSEPWISDGTTAGTVLLRDVNTGGADGLPTDFVSVNGTVFFGCYAGPGAYWLFRTDGTAAGTTLLLGPTEIHELIAGPGVVYFYSTGTGGGYEPWRSDGTNIGTYRIKDIDPAGSSLPHDLTLVGSDLFFSASDGVNGDELWRSDGTEAGTVMVQAIVPGNNGFGTGPAQLRNVNGRLYFVVNDGVNGAELWTGNGAGATLVKDINPGPGSSLGYPAADPAVHRPGLLNGDCLSFNHKDLDRCTLITHLPTLGLDLFWAEDGVHGAEPWVTDGTGAGTVRFDDVYPGPQRSHNYRSMIRIAGQTVFLVTRGPDILPNNFFSTGLWALSLTPALFVGPASVPEGNAGTSTASFTATLFPPGGSPITVSFATADGTATTAGADYVAATGGLTFAPGTTTLAIPVTVNGDTTPESNETFLLNLSGASGAPILTSQGTGTILNDDGPGISVNDVTPIESGTTQFFVTLAATSPNIVSVDFATANGSAAAPGDYTAVSGTLTFAPGVTFRSVNVNIGTDTLDETNETFFLNLSNPIFGVIVDGQGQATITDDDQPPGLSVNNPTVAEPATTGVMGFTATLSALSGQPVTVDYATAPGASNPATADVDYLPISGTLTIPAGTLSGALPVTILGDNIDELNETLFLDLSNAVNANITDAQGLGTITDNDTTNITINNVTVNPEGDPPANPTANFVVTLSVPFHLPVTLDYATAAGTATADVDYVSGTGTLSFAPGTTSQAIPVTVNAEDLDEPTAAETFFVNLTNNSGGNLTDAQGQGSITDDDVSSILGASVTLPEGNSGTTPFDFVLTLSGPSVNTITLNYATVNGTATAPGDYTAASGTLTFAAGTTTTNPVTVNVNGDTASEANETFTLNLSAVTGTTATNPTDPIGTIQNDDTPGFTINDVTVTEGNTGTVNATFTVSLVGTFTGSPSVDFATADGTATAPPPLPGDYNSASGTLTFTAGVTTRTLVVTVVGETLDEANETFFVNLTNPTGGVLVNDAQGIGTITDNDTTSITIPNLTVSEAVAGGTANFVVTFSVPNSQAVTLDYATADGTALAPGDYTAAAGTLSFPAGTTTLGVSVPIIDDTLDEPAAAETFFVNLSNSSGPVITDPQAQGSITDNDASSLSVDNVSVVEGDTTPVDAVFTVSLGGGKTNDVTVDYCTTETGAPAPCNTPLGTATAGADFTPVSGSLSFPACPASPCPAGSLTQSVTVPVVGDTAIEADETLVLKLSNALGATISDSSGTATIVDNDGLPSLSISDVSVIEPSAGTLNSVFTVTLAPTVPQAVNVTYATADGTATAGSDYNTATGTLTFAAGSSTRTITVVVRSDAVGEPAENFLVNLTNPVNADFNDDQGEGTIVDPAFSPTELVHGSGLQADLAALSPTTADQDRYRIQQPRYSSWEVLVDSVSGDVTPVLLERLSSAGSVLQTAAPAGGASASLRWENDSALPVTEERVRVRTGAGGCGVNCDVQDVYRIQALDTTYRVSRFNNSASQTTILLIQNPTEDAVGGTAWFWRASDGTLVGSQAFSIAAKGLFSVNTSTVSGVAATGGTITVTNDAPYGALLGKAVAVEVNTGFTFDTFLEVRAR